MIIVINGSRNSGKSTTASLLAKKLPNSAHIEIDHLRWFLPGLNLEKTIPINLENAVLITRNLTRKKFNVILNYCLRKADYNYLIRNLRKLKIPIHTFTLKPELKAVLSRRGRYVPTADDKKRIPQQYQKSSPHFIQELGTVIDNTNKSPNEVLKIILTRIKNK